MVESKRLKLRGLEWFWHYSPAIFFIIVPLTDLYLIIDSKLNNDLEGYQRMIEGQRLPWVFLGISILLFIYKWHNLKFKVVDNINSINSFNEALVLTTQQLEWTIIEKDENYVIAKSNHSLGSWGEHITILKTGNSILINSICDPQEKPAISSWGGNNRNMNHFIENLKTSVQH